jgi:dGTPase
VASDHQFRERYWGAESPRVDDNRGEYRRDKGRVIHSAAFRRLQAKTQVMGVGEGDFHRTRLTHTIEVAHIGEGILALLIGRYKSDETLMAWLPTPDLLTAACYAHDLGHPPFGHAGERALHDMMADSGGFEGNAQTIRILTRLEKYKRHQGTNPTLRLILAVLKYPAPYSKVVPSPERPGEPRKCYYDSEQEIIERTLSPFEGGDAQRFQGGRDTKGKPSHRSLDCSIMEYADDIAYGVHDLEDISGRRLVQREELIESLKEVFDDIGPRIGPATQSISLEDFEKALFRGSDERKALIGRLVSLFVTSVRIKQIGDFSHPLLRYRCDMEESVLKLMESLKEVTNELVIQRAEVQQLEVRGARIVKKLFGALVSEPEKLIPKASWDWLSDTDSQRRRVCDYIAGMTDPYAERIYERLFIPGMGSSRDEL